MPVWRLWNQVTTQWRAGPFGRIGLDYGAVYLVAETIEVEMSPANLTRLQALERAELNRARQDKEDEPK